MADQPTTHGAPAAKGITREQALAVARKTVAGIEGAERVINEDKIAENPYGWVFFYSPRRYLQTHSPGDLIPGDGPLVVERADGRTEFLTTSVPPAVAVAEFERRWRERQASGKGADIPPRGGAGDAR
jgi:hypothetical protein